VVPVHRRGHAQAGHRLLHRPGTGLVQDPAARARHVRGHVRTRHARGHHHRHGASAVRHWWHRGRISRTGGRHPAGAGRRHSAVRRVLRGARQAQTVGILALVVHYVRIQYFARIAIDE